MESFEQRQKKIIEEFQGLEDWEARYAQIIKKGKALAEMPEDLKVDDNKVKGCQSQVWIAARLNEQGGLEFVADSDALIVKGLVSLLLQVYSGLPPEEILSHQPSFIKDLGFDNHLSPSRSNGFLSMVKQIGYYAKAFQALLEYHKNEGTNQ